MTSPREKDTDDDTPPTPPPPPRKLVPSSLVRVDLGAWSHHGRVRPNNQDHYLVVQIERSLQTLMSNLPHGEVAVRSTETAYGMAVADGMGGRPAGEIASRKAISTLVDLALQTPDWIMRPDDELTKEMCRRMAQRFLELGIDLTERAIADSTLEGMGTTMTLAVTVGDILVVAHAGDSRAYLFRQDRLQRLTRDHTLAQWMADTGEIDPTEVAGHHWRHVLTNVITAGGQPPQAELLSLGLASGDQLLLCTDGLTEMVSEEAIAKTLRESASAADACRALVDLALVAGGVDNVTAVVARYRFPMKPA